MTSGDARARISPAGYDALVDGLARTWKCSADAVRSRIDVYVRVDSDPEPEVEISEQEV